METGKGKYGNRRYVKAHCLSGEKLTQVLHDYIAAVYGKDMPIDYSVKDGDYVAIRVKDDGDLPDRKWMEGRDETTWAVICTEGVGWVADDYNAIEITVFGFFGNNSRFFIYEDRIPEMFTGEEIDLADHVRTFGDRLESNFSLWAGHATDDYK